jgi:lipoprotein-anchoring transpeptidase ErfK/SrfK
MRILFIIAASMILWGCEAGEWGIQPKSPSDSLRVGMLKEANELEKTIEIMPITFTDTSSVTYMKLVNDFGEEGADIILKLNRIDRDHLKSSDTLVVPDTIISNFKYYSPFPLSLREAAEIPKVFFISQTIQAFAAYEYGVMVKWGPTSTGKPSTPTPNGLFHTNWKAEESISTSNDEWLLRWNFNIENLDGVAIHQYDMPGYPASHSCARLLEEDAKWFYNWGEQWVLTPDESDVAAYGTPVIIFGDFDFDDKRPWRYLSENRDANKITRSELGEILSDHIEMILERQTNRESLLATENI